MTESATVASRPFHETMEETTFGKLWTGDEFFDSSGIRWMRIAMEGLWGNRVAVALEGDFRGQLSIFRDPDEVKKIVRKAN